MVTRVTHSNTCLCLRKCFHSFRTNSFFPILHKVVQIRSLNFLPYIANSVSNLVSLHIFSRILFFLAWEKDKTRTIHYSRNDARKIKDGWIIEKACYRCGRPLTIFYTMFPVAEAARDSDTLRFTAAATCPNLIYPGSWPVVAITTGGNPLDRNSLASSTRVNNTPGANANIVDITKVCVGSAPPSPELSPHFEDRSRSRTRNRFRPPFHSIVQHPFLGYTLSSPFFFDDPSFCQFFQTGRRRLLDRSMLA